MTPAARCALQEPHLRELIKVVVMIRSIQTECSLPANLQFLRSMLREKNQDIAPGISDHNNSSDFRQAIPKSNYWTQESKSESLFHVRIAAPLIKPHNCAYRCPGYNTELLALPFDFSPK